MYSWGCWANGRLGLGESVMATQLSPVWVPSQLPLGVRVAQVSAGGTHSLAVATDSTIWSFGNGGHGQLGHGDKMDRLEPTLVEALGLLGQALRPGRLRSGIVHTEAHDIFTFGSTNWLCPEDEDDQLLPVAMKPFANSRGSSAATVTDVALGPSHSACYWQMATCLLLGRTTWVNGSSKETGPTGVTSPAKVALPLRDGSGQRRGAIFVRLNSRML